MYRPFIPLDVGENEHPIPLPNVSATVLTKVHGHIFPYPRTIHQLILVIFLLKVLEYCEHHRADPMPVADAEDDVRKRTTEIGEWDQKFIAVDQEMLFEIILAANYLDIKPLLCVPWLQNYRLISFNRIHMSHSSSPALIVDRDVGCKTVANMIKGKTPEEIRKLFNIVNDFTPEEEVSARYIASMNHLPSPTFGADIAIVLLVGPNQERERVGRG